MFNNNRCCQQRQNCSMPRACPPMQECPITEPTITNCVEENIYHEVPHIMPMHTHVIKRHIYNHTYTPKYSCSEECQVVNNECGCPKFMNR